MSKFFGVTVLFVRNYDRCLEFYRNALGMEVLRTHKGEGHPDWALLQLGDLRMALHAGHEGEPLRGGAVCINFFVDDIHLVVERIQQFDGSIKKFPEEHDFRPTQPVMAFFGRFADPDGNEHYLVKETRRFPDSDAAL